MGVHGNEIVDSLAKYTSNLIRPSIYNLPFTDFIPILRHHTSKLWLSQWLNSPANFAARFKSIVPVIPSSFWFQNLNLSTSFIIQFNRLRMGHSLLPAHKLGLTFSPFCPLHPNEAICDLSHILSVCLSLSTKRVALSNFFESLNMPLNLPCILSLEYELASRVVFFFISKSGFNV